jgi:RimJ/RimL family protein N-acetyltransferase
LRPLRIDDAPACAAAASDPETVRYTEVPHPYQTSDAESFVTVLAPRRWLEGSAGIFAIADADDAFVGTIDLRLAGDELTTDLGDVGYLVGPWARGKGYASAALRAVCDWGFAELGLHRIEWRAYVGNTGSRSVARRAGLTVEGITRRGLNHRGSYEDAWLGARLRED